MHAKCDLDSWFDNNHCCQLFWKRFFFFHSPFALLSNSEIKNKTHVFFSLDCKCGDEKVLVRIMWPGFEKFNTKQDNSSQNETIDHISTIAGSLASIGTEHTESPVRTDHILLQNVTRFFFFCSLNIIIESFLCFFLSLSLSIAWFYAGLGWSRLRYRPYRS